MLHIVGKLRIMPPSLPPKVLKLTPHVDSCLLLQLLPALLQHYPHRRLVELAGCGNRRILSRVLLNIVQPDINKIFLNIYENGKARLDNTWEDCESQSAWFHPPCRNICTSRRISHLRLFHGAFFRRLALSQLASKSTNSEEIYLQNKRGRGKVKCQRATLPVRPCVSSAQQRYRCHSGGT